MVSKRIKTKISGIIILVIIMAAFTYAHELVHSTVADYYGYESEINFDCNNRAVVCTNINESSANLTEEQKLSFLEMNSMTEIIGYQLFILIMVVSILLIFIRNKVKEYEEEKIRR